MLWVTECVVEISMCCGHQNVLWVILCVVSNGMCRELSATHNFSLHRSTSVKYLQQVSSVHGTERQLCYEFWQS